MFLSIATELLVTAPVVLEAVAAVVGEVGGMGDIFLFL
jgi:hypothetical protein